MESTKRLLKLRMYYNIKDNIWSLKILDNEAVNTFHFKATNDMIKRLFTRMKVKDEIIYPNKRKMVTYQGIIDYIKEKGLGHIFIWKSYCPKSLQDLERLMRK